MSTLKEFNLKDEDLPSHMKSDAANQNDLVEQNIRLSHNRREFNKAVYLSKLKMNIENQESSKERNQIQNNKKREIRK